MEYFIKLWNILDYKMQFLIYEKTAVREEDKFKT